MVLGTFIKEVYLNGHTSFLKTFTSRMLYFISSTSRVRASKQKNKSYCFEIMSLFAVWTIKRYTVADKKRVSSYSCFYGILPLSMETLTGLRACTIPFLFVFHQRGESRERRKVYLSCVSPCIFPILLKQVNGKRAFPRLPFVFHEMFSSRIESLCQDTFARCVIRSPLLLVKESPPVAIAFSRCKGTYISKGVQYRWIILHTGYFRVYRSYFWFCGFLQIQSYIFIIKCNISFLYFLEIEKI